MLGLSLVSETIGAELGGGGCEDTACDAKLASAMLILYDNLREAYVIHGEMVGDVAVVNYDADVFSVA